MTKKSEKPMAVATGWNVVKCEPGCDAIHVWLFSPGIDLHLDAPPDIALEIARKIQQLVGQDSARVRR
jgi:hypothetical protein